MTKVLSLFLAFCCCVPCLGEEEKPQADLPYIVILYGAPGSGRAGMAVRVRRDFDFPNISLATLLANHVLEGTSLGNKGQDYFINGGDLPPELLPAILCERLLEPDCSRGIFLEDMSLSVDQISDIQKQLSRQFRFLVITIDSTDDWLIQKVEHRFVCYACGYVYDDSESNRKDRTNCDVCSSPLQRRQGDAPDVIRSRLEGYRAQLAPLLDLYKKQGVLFRIPGNRKFDETYKDLLSTIEQKTGLLASRAHSELGLQAVE